MDAPLELAPRGVRREHEPDRMAAEMLAQAYQRLQRAADAEGSAPRVAPLMPSKRVEATRVPQVA